LFSCAAEFSETIVVSSCDVAVRPLRHNIIPQVGALERKLYLLKENALWHLQGQRVKTHPLTHRASLSHLRRVSQCSIKCRLKIEIKIKLFSKQSTLFINAGEFISIEKEMSRESSHLCLLQFLYLSVLFLSLTSSIVSLSLSTLRFGSEASLPC